MSLVAFERVAELRIREAMAEGKFDNLPGRGQPIDLEDYFRTPVELRLAHSVLKSANCLPEEVELMNEAARLERSLSKATDPAASERRRRLRDVRLRLAILRERRKQSRRIR